MIYTVWLPPETEPTSFWNREGGRSLTLDERKSRIVILRDGLSPFALMFPLLWLAWNRLWYALVVFVLLTSAYSILVPLGYLPVYWVMYLLTGLYLLLEGRHLIADKLERQGYQPDSIVIANSRKNAEIKYFHDALSGDNHHQAVPQTEKNSQSGQGVKPYRRYSLPTSQKEKQPSVGLFAD